MYASQSHENMQGFEEKASAVHVATNHKASLFTCKSLAEVFPSLAALAVMLGLIFGGCCSNVNSATLFYWLYKV